MADDKAAEKPAGAPQQAKSKKTTKESKVAEDTLIMRPAFDYDYPQYITNIERFDKRTGETKVNPYIGADGRLAGFTDMHRAEGKRFTIASELHEDGKGRLVCTCTIDSDLLGCVTAHAAAYGKSTVDQSNPIENAETSALARALGMLGFGLVGGGGLATAEDVHAAQARLKQAQNMTDVKRAQQAAPKKPQVPKATDRKTGVIEGGGGISHEQNRKIHAMVKKVNLTTTEIKNMKTLYSVEHTTGLTHDQASDLIDLLTTIENAVAAGQPKPDVFAAPPAPDEGAEALVAEESVGGSGDLLEDYAAAQAAAEADGIDLDAELGLTGGDEA